MTPAAKGFADTALAVETAIHGALANGRRRPLCVGICGAQGGGKSTLAAALKTRLSAAGIATVVLSLDDLYRTQAERRALAAEVHPLLAVRGPPGTHDVAMGLTIFEALDQGRPAALPRFDKASDDRSPQAEWDVAAGDTQLIIFEGWCVGARPQAEAALAEPVNTLEREDDPDGAWRSYVNRALGGGYQRLFARIDLLVLLAAPSFEVVCGWRIEQEHALAASRTGAGLLSDAEIGRFVQFYERITRHILAEAAPRADLLIRLDADRAPLEILPRVIS